MTTVLTIDFDIIMEPDIELYNDLVGGSIYVDDLLEDHPLFNNLRANFYIYEYLTRLIIQTSKILPKENIHFIENHNEIINYFDKKKNLINIDHHHDICYDEDDFEKKLLFDEVGCGNWVKYLMDENLVGEYLWLTDNTSVNPDEEIADKYPHLNNLVHNVKIKLAPTDELVICLSEPWIPYYYRGLFDIWMTICEEEKNTTYNFEKETKNEYGPS